MHDTKRISIIRSQPRAYLYGTVEYIHEDWVFFDEESDEAQSLHEFNEEIVQIYRQQNWWNCELHTDGLVTFQHGFDYLQDGERIRIQKTIPISLQNWLLELREEVFQKMMTTLENLDYSIFDCLYCHNFLQFLEDLPHRSGTNFVILDNTDWVLSIHHYFKRTLDEASDTFIFARSDGLTMEISM